MAENQPLVPVADPAAPAVPGAVVTPPGSDPASVLPPGSAVPPTDPGVPAAAPTGAPPTGTSPPAGTPPAEGAPVPEFIPRAVHEEQFRSLQSAKDKEIADLQQQNQQLQQSQAQPASAQAPASAEEFDADRWLQMMDTDKKAGMDYLRSDVRRDVMREVQVQQQANQQQQDAYSQYLTTFQKATEGFTPEEYQRAVLEVQQSFSQGNPVSPYEAAQTGRFGSVQQAMDFAQQHMATLQPPPGAQPGTPPAVPPVVPGAAPVQVPPGQGAPPQDPSGTYRSIFAD